MTDNEERRRDWMEGHLDWAAQELGVERVGTPLHTSRFHSSVAASSTPARMLGFESCTTTPSGVTATT